MIKGRYKVFYIYNTSPRVVEIAVELAALEVALVEASVGKAGAVGNAVAGATVVDVDVVIVTVVASPVVGEIAVDIEEGSVKEAVDGDNKFIER